MAIKAIEERGGTGGLRVIGKLRKGSVKPEKGPGRDLGEMFRFTSNDPKIMDVFLKVYGTDQPAILRAYLPYPTLRQNWDYFFESWKAGARLIYRCNGQDWIRWLTPDGKAYSRDPKPCPICSGERQAATGEHKLSGRLMLVLDDLLYRGGVTGVVMVETHAITDVYEINNCFRALDNQRTILDDDYRGIGIVVWREMRKVPTKEHGVRDLAVVRFEPVVEWVKAQLQRARTDALGRVPTLDPRTGELLDEDWAEEAAEETEETEKPAPEAAEDRPSATPAEEAPAATAPVKETPWFDIRENQNAIRAVVKDAKLTNAEVLDILKVEQIRDFPGGFNDVVTALREGAKEKNAVPPSWRKGETRAVLMRFVDEACKVRALPVLDYDVVRGLLSVEHLADYQDGYLQAQKAILDELERQVAEKVDEVEEIPI
jgi:hypothetical protein